MADTQDLTDQELHDLAIPVRSIALEAGEEILRVMAQGYEVTTKVDRTPVTDADHAAEAVILSGLARLTPEIPAVSEEAATAGHAPDVSGGPYWLVDPLDGTREFVAGGKEFCVCIGLIAAGCPVFGLLYGPALDITFWTASRSSVISAKGGGDGVKVAARACPETDPTAITSRFHGRSGRLARYLEEMQPANHIFMSSALKFGYLADGSADIYPRFGPTSEWDTAAGHAILNAAGGRVTTLDGADLSYGKANFINPDFIARGVIDA